MQFFFFFFFEIVEDLVVELLLAGWQVNLFWEINHFMSAKPAQMLQMANSAHKGDKNAILAAINQAVAAPKPLTKEEASKKAHSLVKEKSGIS